MRLAMAQINATVGDLDGNTKKIREYIERAKRYKTDLVVFPELAVTGYPPQDLLFENSFIEENKKSLKKLIRHTADIAAVVGFVDYKGKNLYNAAAVFDGNKLISVVYKTLLPTYDVFDEDRYFKPAEKEEIRPIPMNLNGEKFALGVEICEDLWDRNYNIEVTDLLAKRGADVVVNISASPFHVVKRFERELVAGKIEKKQNSNFLCQYGRRTR